MWCFSTYFSPSKLCAVKLSLSMFILEDPCLSKCNVPWEFYMEALWQLLTMLVSWRRLCIRVEVELSLASSLGSLSWSWFPAAWPFHPLVRKSPINREAAVYCQWEPACQIPQGHQAQILAQVTLVCIRDCHLSVPFPHALSVCLIDFVSLSIPKSGCFPIERFYFYLES